MPNRDEKMQELNLIQNKSDVPLILFGARNIGEMTYHACKKLGIKVKCYTDDKIKGSLNGLNIYHTNELNKRFPKARFLICSANIQDMVERLNQLGYDDWYSCGFVLNGFEAKPEHCKNEVDYEQDYVDYLLSTCIIAHQSFMNPSKLFIKNVDLVITEKCSMACVDCANLMPYFEKPRNYTFEALKYSIDIMSTYFDEIAEVRVIGGEPFMNKDFAKIVEMLSVKKNIMRIAIYTNGTIVPNDEKIKSLENEKVFLYITDYDELSRNLKKLEEKLKEKNIFHYIHKAAGWTDCATIKKFNRTTEQNINLFKNCCAKNLATLSEGKIFRCPFAASAFQLKGIPDDPDDYIDIVNLYENEIKPEKIRRAISTYLFEKDYIPACDFCSGRSYGDPEIKPATQTKEKIPYKKYE
tara:strand:- start:1186 stop:2418 length:1233 start_codon:yes stop_codon:yes gene_type:complete